MVKATSNCDWIKSRCHRCVFYGGGDICLRDYPSTKIVENCRLRPYPKAKWRDAFIPRSSIFNSVIDSEVVSLQNTLTKDEKELRIKQYLGAYLYAKEERKRSISIMNEDGTKTNSERQKELNAYLRRYKRNVESKGGQVIVGFGKDLPDSVLEVRRLSTGIISLDTNLGGGFPRGGCFTIAGGEGSGKSTLGLRIAAAIQKQGGIPCLVDAEHTFDRSWAEVQGVDVDNLLLIQADTLEDTLNLATDVVRDGMIDILIYDSLDAAIARKSMETKKGKTRDLDDDDIALKARQLSRFFPRILHGLRVNDIGLMLIAQYRTSGIGTAWVNPFNISGGNARRFYDWLTLELRKGGKAEQIVNEDTGVVDAFTVHMSVKKSKLSGVREGHSFDTLFFHNQGFNTDYEKVKYAYDKGLIVRVNNSNHMYVDTNGVEHKIGFGKESKVINKLIEDGLVDDIWKKASGEESQVQQTGS